MTLEQAYEKVQKMDEVLDSDILSDEEYTSVAKQRFQLMQQIGLEEQRRRQMASPYPHHLSDWERGFLDGYVIQGHKLHYITQKQRAIFYAIGGWDFFQYRGYLFKFIKNSLLVQKIAEKVS